MNDHLIRLVKKHYGSSATIERKLSGGVRIITPSGEIELKDRTLQSILGGSDMYRATLLFTHEMWGTVRVSGTAPHVLACMAHGKELGLDVIPEGDKKGSFGLTVAFAGLGFCFGTFAGLFLLNVNSFEPFEAGFVAALVTGVIANPFIETVLARDARWGGQEYRDIFPEIHGSERRANRDAARERGLL